MTRPMDTLPLELYQEVFAFAVGSPNEVQLHSDIAPLTIAGILAPYRLAAVCTSWRAICLQTAELWAYIQLGNCASEHVKDYMLLHLLRSAGHALDVWTANFASFADGFDAYYALMQPIVENAYRWRRVRLCFPKYASVKTVLAPCSSMPALQSFVVLTGSVRSNQMVDENDEPAGLNILRHAPNLTYLARHVNALTISTSMDRLQYLSFSLRGMPTDTSMWQTLPMTPNLKELEIYFPSFNGIAIEANYELHGMEIRLPHLRQLAVYGFPPEDDVAWVDRLYMPLLETLLVSIESMDPLTTVFAKVRKEVRHVIITSVEPDRNRGYFDQVDARSLDQLSTLETLELRDLTPDMLKLYNQSFFDHLIGEYDKTRPQPAWAAGLEHLILRDCTVYLNSCRKLAQFVQMREDAARDGGPPFDFQVHGCMFLATRTESFAPVWSYFANSTFYGESLNDYYPREDDEDDDEKYGAKWSVELLEKLIIREDHTDQPECDAQNQGEAALGTDLAPRALSVS
ncbi:hypothetical protein BKA62DRAFT_306364 [Auriculariales sp. MPI-PUGE-AT-0066]|nr:hypothetical protein BKA62DRAFT_306364 [Auriculariales sp. MPI-PUGE-AT-0066]